MWACGRAYVYICICECVCACKSLHIYIFWTHPRLNTQNWCIVKTSQLETNKEKEKPIYHTLAPYGELLIWNNLTAFLLKHWLVWSVRIWTPTWHYKSDTNKSKHIFFPKPLSYTITDTRLASHIYRPSHIIMCFIHVLLAQRHHWKVRSYCETITIICW